MRLTSCVREERSRRRTIEEQLIQTKHAYEKLQLFCEQLNNPIERFLSSHSIQQETDVEKVKEALEVYDNSENNHS